MLTSHYGRTVHSEVPVTGVFNLNDIEDFDTLLCNAIDPDDTPEGCEQFTALVGFATDEAELFVPDSKSALCAILRLGSNVAQVLRSNHVLGVSLCSPCYPGQGDADSTGEYLCYSFPHELIGEEFHNRVIDLPQLTEQQELAYSAVKAKWPFTGTPQATNMGCVMVQVFNQDGNPSMWLGIEPDGYTHS